MDLSASSHPSTAVSERDRSRLTIALCAVGVCYSLDRNVIGVLLEPIKAEFQATDTMLGLLTGFSFVAFYVIVGIPLARIADRGDRRLIICLSIAAWSIMTAVCGFAKTFTQLVVARFGVGAGEAGSLPAAHSLIADYFPPERRAKAIGIFTASQSVGYAVGLALGGLIAQSFGWRVALWAVASIGLVIVPLAMLLIREPRSGARRVTSGPTEPLLTSLSVLYRKRTFRYIVIAVSLYFIMAFGSLGFSVSFMIRVHELSIASAGVAFGAITTAGAFIGGIYGGKLGEKAAKRSQGLLATLSFTALMLSFVLYQCALIVPTAPIALALMFFAIISLNAAVPALFSLIHLVCGSERRAFAVSLLFLCSNIIGVGIGPLLTGYISDLLAPKLGVADALRAALLIINICLIPAAAFALASKMHVQEETEL